MSYVLAGTRLYGVWMYRIFCIENLLPYNRPCVLAVYLYVGTLVSIPIPRVLYIYVCIWICRCNLTYNETFYRVLYERTVIMDVFILFIRNYILKINEHIRFVVNH